jgi:hypothetical protein
MWGAHVDDGLENVWRCGCFLADRFRRRGDHTHHAHVGIGGLNGDPTFVHYVKAFFGQRDVFWSELWRQLAGNLSRKVRVKTRPIVAFEVRVHTRKG